MYQNIWETVVFWLCNQSFGILKQGFEQEALGRYNLPGNLRSKMAFKQQLNNHVVYKSLYACSMKWHMSSSLFSFWIGVIGNSRCQWSFLITHWRCSKCWLGYPQVLYHIGSYMVLFGHDVSIVRSHWLHHVPVLFKPCGWYLLILDPDVSSVSSAKVALTPDSPQVMIMWT